MSSINNPDYFAKKIDAESVKHTLPIEYPPNLKITKEGELTHYSFESPSLDFSYTTKPVSFDNADQRVEQAMGEVIFEDNGKLKEGFKIEDLFIYENFKLNNKASPSLNLYFDKLNENYVIVGCNKPIPNKSSLVSSAKFIYLSEPLATIEGMISLVHEVGHTAHEDILTEESVELHNQSRIKFEKLSKEIVAFLRNDDAVVEILNKYNWDELLEDGETNKIELQKIRHEAVVNRANKSFTFSKEERRKIASIILESERSADAFVLKFFKNTANDLGITVEDVKKLLKNYISSYITFGKDILPEEYDEWGGKLK